MNDPGPSLAPKRTGTRTGNDEKKTSPYRNVGLASARGRKRPRDKLRKRGKARRGVQHLPQLFPYTALTNGDKTPSFKIRLPGIGKREGRKRKTGT